MFEDSLVESGGTVARRNPWTIAVSFTVQGILAAMALLMSLLFTDALPIRALISTVEMPPPAAEAPPASHAVKLARQPSEFNKGVLILPREIPGTIARVHDNESQAQEESQALGVPYGIGNATPTSALSDLLRGSHTAVPTVAVQKVRVSSGVEQGLLIKQVKPQYPILAQQARVQGTVVLQAVIGKDGTVQDLRVVSGHPLLTGAAIAAVKQWLYRPYYLNDRPVSVDTQINVNFVLNGE
jgi:protein TonB